MLDPEVHGSAIRRFGEWAVTTNGLAKADGSRHIPVVRLWDLWKDPERDKWGWPLQAAKQGWITPEDKDQFNDAFFFALEQYKAFQPPLHAKPSSRSTLTAQDGIFNPKA